MKRRRKTTRGKQAWRVWVGCWARGQLSPSQEDSHRGWEPSAGLYFYSLRRLLFEINIEKRVSPDPTAREPALSCHAYS